LAGSLHSTCLSVVDLQAQCGMSFDRAGRVIAFQINRARRPRPARSRAKKGRAAAATSPLFITSACLPCQRTTLTTCLDIFSFKLEHRLTAYQVFAHHLLKQQYLYRRRLIQNQCCRRLLTLAYVVRSRRWSSDDPWSYHRVVILHSTSWSRRERDKKARMHCECSPHWGRLTICDAKLSLRQHVTRDATVPRVNQLTPLHLTRFIGWRMQTLRRVVLPLR